MLVLKGLRYRAYPSAAQMAFVRQIGGCARLVYNLAREQRRLFGRRGRAFRYEGQRAELKALKEAAPFLCEVPHHALQEALVNLEQAYGRFYSSLAGYPRPRRPQDGDSFRLPDPKQIRIVPSGDRRWALLRLPKMGKSRGDHGPLRIRLHRPVEGKVRSVTVSIEGEQLYVSILVAQHLPEPRTPTGAPIGVDRGVAVAIMTSEGAALHVPVPTVREEERKRRLQRALSRAKRGSRNRLKARRALARHEAKAARRRRDGLHKATTAMTQGHRLVAIKDLRVRAMTASARGTAEAPGVGVAQKAGLNRAILTRGWGLAERMLAYKTAWHGSELAKVPAQHSSQECSAYGHVDPASRVLDRCWVAATPRVAAPRRIRRFSQKLFAPITFN